MLENRIYQSHASWMRNQAQYLERQSSWSNDSKSLGIIAPEYCFPHGSAIPWLNHVTVEERLEGSDIAIQEPMGWITKRDDNIKPNPKAVQPGF